MIFMITIMAIIGPNMNDYTYSAQNLSQKSFAPRVPGLEKLGIFDLEEIVDNINLDRLSNNPKKLDRDDLLKLLSK